MQESKTENLPAKSDKKHAPPMQMISQDEGEELQLHLVALQSLMEQEIQSFDKLKNRNVTSEICERQLIVRFLPENRILTVDMGETLVIGRRGRQKHKLESGEIMQGKQLAGGRMWYVGLNDDTLNGTQCTLRYSAETQQWCVENPQRATTHGMRGWSDNKQKFKRIAEGYAVQITQEWTRFQLGKRSELQGDVGEKETHEIQVCLR